MSPPPGQEYGPQRGERVRVSSQPHRSVPVPEQVDSPAAISTVAEIVEAVTERLLGQSRTQLRRETRPLKLSIAGLGALVIATCGWGYSQVSTWQDTLRNQWVIEAKQTEQDDAMAAHLDAPHVSPAQIQALEKKLGEIEKKLDDVLAPKVEEPTKVRVPRR